MSELKRTPLAEEHERAGGRMVPFAGWYMPVEFEGLRQEHNRVREAVGLFDVSHMGEIRVKGANSLKTLQWLMTNDVSRLNDGQAQYTLLPNDQGGLVDDLIVYCVRKEQEYLLCVNASNKDKDFKWIIDHNKGAEIIDESEQWGQIAVQGPKARELSARVLGPSVMAIDPFHFAEVVFAGGRVLVARTGYTGEDGFEIFVPKNNTVSLWRALIEKGQDLGVQPIGLGARDTLRTEMKYSLYGNEIDDNTNPYEAGLGWVIKPEAKEFLGMQKIVSVKEQGLKRKLIGFKMVDRGIPRHDYKLFSFDNKEIGKVTSGTLSPTLNDNIGIGYVTVDQANLGNAVFVDIRGRKVKAEVVATPFVKVKGAK